MSKSRQRIGMDKWKMREGFYRFEVVGTREKVLSASLLNMPFVIIPNKVISMAKATTHEIDGDEAKQLEAAVNNCIAEMQQANQRMDKRQIEIDTLKAETRAMLNQIHELMAA